jgi:predicted NAD-dependent protein-ADP-ribosyltransferase YbiA (DUF1768 family)
MSWDTDEQALVKKIATVLAKGYGTGGNKKVLDIDERVARAVLVAVGPMIAAQALRDAAGDARHRWGVKPDPSDWMRARADKIEKEARRD